eukprot:GHVU01067490.1.p1 GENE.GHVU01067490.1~~GHVU01067490.1.p1  ORF type:complete len:190 (+),score=18.11 GHVU01067490.1:224-793(+)
MNLDSTQKQGPETTPEDAISPEGGAPSSAERISPPRSATFFSRSDMSGAEKTQQGGPGAGTPLQRWYSYSRNSPQSHGPYTSTGDEGPHSRIRSKAKGARCYASGGPRADAGKPGSRRFNRWLSYQLLLARLRKIAFESGDMDMSDWDVELAGPPDPLHGLEEYGPSVWNELAMDPLLSTCAACVVRWL